MAASGYASGTFQRPSTTAVAPKTASGVNMRPAKPSQGLQRPVSAVLPQSMGIWKQEIPQESYDDGYANQVVSEETKEWERRDFNIFLPFRNQNPP